MTVAAHEYVGLCQRQRSLEFVRIVPWPAPDVGHQHSQASTFEKQTFLEFIVKAEIVAVTPHGPYRLPGLQFLEHSGAYVARMPQFIAILEKREHLRSQHPVRVGKHTDANHHSLASTSFRFSAIISLR